MLFDKSKIINKIKKISYNIKKKEIGLSLFQFAIIVLLVVAKR